MNALSWSRSSAAAMVASVVALTWSPAPASAGGPCSVPGDQPTIQAAVDNVACTTINLATQVFSEEVVITRSLTLNGNGATIDGGGVNRPLEIDATGTGGVSVSLSNLSLTNGKLKYKAGDTSFPSK